MPLGLVPPPGHQVGHDVGMPVGEIGRLRGIGLQVVELPGVLLQRRVVDLDGVVDDRLPLLVADRPAAEHLVVLGRPRIGGVGVGQGGGEAGPLQGTLLDPVDHGRRLDAHEGEQGRRQVDGVHVLVADLTRGTDAGGPVHDHRVGHAAFVDLPLPTTEGRVAGDRPTPRVVVVDVGPADVVDAVQRLRDRAVHAVPGPQVVQGADRSALRAGSVVGHDHDDRVVEVAGLGQRVDDPAHLGVGVGEVAGEGLHVALVDAALVLAEVRPGRDPGRAGGQDGVAGQQPFGLLTLEGGLPPDVPPLLEAAPIGLDPVGRGLVG